MIGRFDFNTKEKKNSLHTTVPTSSLCGNSLFAFVLDRSGPGMDEKGAFLAKPEASTGQRVMAEDIARTLALAFTSIGYSAASKAGAALGSNSSSGGGGEVWIPPPLLFIMAEFLVPVYPLRIACTVQMNRRSVLLHVFCQIRAVANFFSTTRDISNNSPFARVARFFDALKAHEQLSASEYRPEAVYEVCANAADEFPKTFASIVTRMTDAIGMSHTRSPASDSSAELHRSGRVDGSRSVRCCMRLFMAQSFFVPVRIW